MSSWQSTTIKIAEQDLHLQQTLPNGPAVMLIHGYTDSSRSWSRLAADLADAYTVYAPDMLGHGSSPRLGGPTSVARYVDDVLSLLDALDLEQVALCGHSMGGVIIGGVTAAQPDRISALICEDPAWTRQPVPEPEYLGSTSRGQEWREWITKLRTMSHSGALESIAAETAGWAEVDRRHYLADRLDFDLAIFDQLDFSVRNGWRDHLRANRAPLLLVTGSPENGGIVDDAFAELIFQLNGGGERLHIPAAGHGIHREQYAPFYSGVRAFLDTHI